MDRSKKAKPSPEAVRAAERLKRLWLAIPRDRRLTQDQLAERYGEGGTQSLISQYMNGLIPLNIRAVMFFARELNCRPDEIYPDLPGLDGMTEFYRDNTGMEYPEGAQPRDSESMTSDAAWATFSPEQKRRILELVEIAGLIGKPAPASQSRPITAKDVRQSDAAVELRRQRKARRSQRGSHKRNIP